MVFEIKHFFKIEKINRALFEMLGFNAALYTVSPSKQRAETAEKVLSR